MGKYRIIIWLRNIFTRGVRKWKSMGKTKKEIIENVVMWMFSIVFIAIIEHQNPIVFFLDNWLILIIFGILLYPLLIAREYSLSCNDFYKDKDKDNKDNKDEEHLSKENDV